MRTNIKTLAKHTAHYFYGGLLVYVISFITFPIYVRILSVKDYGALEIISATIGLVDGIFSLGANQSLMRLYQQTKSSGQEILFFSTLKINIIISGFSLFFLILIASPLLNDVKVFNINLLLLAILASGTIFISNLVQLYLTLFRIQELLLCYNFFNLLSVSLKAVCGIVMAFTFRSVLGLLVGNLLGSFISFLFISLYSLRRIKIKIAYSVTLSKSALKYGLPLALNHLPAKLFIVSDRYCINFMLGTQAVAIYSVGSKLALYIKDLIVAPLNNAIFPLVMNMIGRKEEKKIAILLGKSLKYYLYLMVPIIACIFVLSQDLIVIIAGTRYLESYNILNFLIVGIGIAGFVLPFSIGLHYMKYSKLILMITICMTLFNIFLNLIFIPFYGLMGAVYATIIAYILNSFILHLISKKYFKVKFLIKYYMIAILAGLLSVAIGYWIKIIMSGLILHALSTDLLVSLFCILIYFSIIFLVDVDLRYALNKNLIQRSKNNGIRLWQ